MMKIKIAVIDSGISDHPDIAIDKIKCYGYDGHSLTDDYKDYYGHGTAILGIISKCLDYADIISIKICNNENGTEERHLIDVLNYIYNYMDVDIINLSLGLNICEDMNALYDICVKLNEKGVILVSAYDNNGSFSYPAVFDNVIGVTSGFYCKKINDFEFIDDSLINIAANGNIQRLAWTNPQYVMLGGNSFACAHVTAKIGEWMSKEIKSKNEILVNFKNIAIYQHREEKKNKKCNKSFPISKAVIFPFNKEMHSLIRFYNLLSFKIVDVFDTKYSFRVRARTRHLLKDENVADFIIKNIEDINWSNFDTLILGHVEELMQFDEQACSIKKLITETIKNQKRIYSFGDISNIELDNNIFFPSITNNDLPPLRFGKLFKISKPVVGVFGTSSKQGKYTLQLMIRKILMEKGYNIGQIGTEPNAYLFGIDYTFPIGYNSTVDLDGIEIIRYLNDKINELCLKNVDIILVGSQSGTVPFDVGNIERISEHQFHFLVGASPDIVILCVNPYDDFKYIKRSINFIEAVANCKVIAITVFPMTIRNMWAGIYAGKEKIEDSVYEELKIKLTSFFDLPIYNLDCQKDILSLAENIIDCFS